MTIEAGVHIPTWTMGDRLRKAREHAGLEQRDLADAIEVSRATIGNYERGRGKPRRIVLRQWALRTGVPLEWLETGATPQGDPGPDGLPRLDSNQQPAGLHFASSRQRRSHPIGR